MTYILYNELSNRGKPLKVAQKLEKKYLKKDKKVVLINIITAKENTKELISRLTKEDEVILLGGDGTIHRFFNHMRGITPPCRVFFRSCPGLPECVWHRPPNRKWVFPKQCHTQAIRLFLPYARAFYLALR